MGETLKLLVLSWDELHTLLIELAKTIGDTYRPEIIVGVARGGLVPARIVADLLEVPVVGAIGVTFYEDINQRSRSPAVTQPLSISVENKSVLVVDDIADTGESLTLVVSKVKAQARTIRTATVFRKPWSRIIPDYSARETNAWVVFPWELNESAKKIGRKLLDSGKTLAEVENYLVSAGIKSPFVQALIEDLRRKRCP